MNPEAALGAAMLLAAAWLTWTAAHRASAWLVPNGVGEPTERVLATLHLTALCLVWPVVGLGLGGQLTPLGLALVAALLYLASRRLPRPGPPAGSRPSADTATRFGAALTALLVALDLAAFLPAPPVDWDAMTYHLYFPARWLEAGRLFHLPTVFGDNAAAFAPQNGALFFAWQLALLGHDTLINVSQLGALCLLGLALYHIARRLGAARSAATLAALTLPWIEPLRQAVYSANVDLLMAAFAFAAFHWQLAYLRRPSWATLLACGLAAGLAAGTKTVGLPLALLTALPLGIVLGRGRRAAHLGGFLTAFLVAGGGWYLINFWAFQNPLFPLHISLGPLHFPGAYDTAAVKAGEFHLAGPGAVAASALGQLGPTTCLLAGLGLLALGYRAVKDLLRRRAPAPLLLAFAVLWGAFFFLAVPHNDQARFLLPTLVAGLTGWALVLDRARRSSPAAAVGCWLAGIATASWASRPWADWRASFEALAEAGISVGLWLTLAGLALTALGFLSLRRGGHRRIRALAAGLVAWSLVTLAVTRAEASRSGYFARADYQGWSEGYLPFQRPEAPPLRIAYAGANIPYAMVGPALRNTPIYVNTQGRPGDGFYDFWRRDPKRYPYHKPGLYRGRDDYPLWLSNLEAERIDLVAVFALHWAERRYLHATPEGFPIEKQWMDHHPERFEPLFDGRVAALYRFSRHLALRLPLPPGAQGANPTAVDGRRPNAPEIQGDTTSHEIPRGHPAGTGL